MKHPSRHQAIEFIDYVLDERNPVAASNADTEVRVHYSKTYDYVGTELPNLAMDFDEMREDEGNDIEYRGPQEGGANHWNVSGLDGLVNRGKQTPRSETHAILSIGPPDFEVHHANLISAGPHTFEKMVPLVWTLRDPVRFLENKNPHGIEPAGG